MGVVFGVIFTNASFGRVSILVLFWGIGVLVFNLDNSGVVIRDEVGTVLERLDGKVVMGLIVEAMEIGCLGISLNEGWGATLSFGLGGVGIAVTVWFEDIEGVDWGTVEEVGTVSVVCIIPQGFPSPSGVKWTQLNPIISPWSVKQSKIGAGGNGGRSGVNGGRFSLHVKSNAIPNGTESLIPSGAKGKAISIPSNRSHATHSPSIGFAITSISLEDDEPINRVYLLVESL